MRRIHLTVLGLFFLSGACGLVYEITWMRLFRLVLGNTVFTSATVLTAFMAGLALGSYLASRLVDRHARPLRLYATLEVLIGLCGLVMPLALAAAEPLYGWLYERLMDSALLLGLSRFLVSAALLLPATTLMGATLPLLSRFLSQRRERLGRDIGHLYALNTLGAALGASITGFLLVPALGVQTTLIGAALGNWIIGAAAFYLARERPPSPAAPSSASSEPGDRTILWALAATGFATMIYEVAWTRTLSMLIGSSVYAFTLMLVAFIAGLGLGSLVLSSWIDRRHNLFLCLGLMELVVGVAVLLVGPLFGLLPIYMVGVVSSNASSFAALHLVEFLIVFVLMLVPTFIAGGIFPAAAKIYTRDLSRVGRSVGEIYAANTLGAVLGSFAAGFLLVPYLGAQPSIAAAVGLNLIMGFYFLRRGGVFARLRWVALAALAVLLAATGMTRLATWDTALLNSAPYLYAEQYRSAARMDKSSLDQVIRKNRRLLYLEEGVTATVTVWDMLGELFMRVNGKVVASSKGKDLRSHSLLAHLPLMLHEQPRDVLLIGLGGGITLGALERHPVENVECVEISPEVVRAARLFGPVNYDALDDSRLQMIVGDGRNHVALGRRSYDVIISQPSNLWIAGMADLFTREFFVACRERLARGGLAATWIQAYSLPDRDLKTIVRTFRSVFPHVTMWELMPGIDYLLVGSEEQLPLHYEDLARRLDDVRIESDLRRSGAGDIQNLACSMVMQDEQIDAFVSDGPVSTDDNAILEFSAPKGLYRDLSRSSHFGALESLRPYRQTDLTFLAESDSLERAWRARQLAIEGLLFQNSGQYARALTSLERAARTRADDMEVQRAFPELIFKLAEQHLRQRRYDAALALYDRLLAVLPGEPAGQYRKGELHEALGHKTQAAAAYERAATLSPEFLGAHMRLGAMYMGLGQLDRAAAAYRRALETHPRDLGLLSNLGTVYMVQQRFEEGMAVFERALALDPDDSRVWNNLGTAHLRQKSYGEARRWLEGAVERRPDDPVLYKKLADVYWRLGEEEEARAAARQALELSPGDGQARRLVDGPSSARR